MGFAQPVMAADCPLHDAIYRDARGTGFEMHFHRSAPHPPSDMITSSFTISFGGMDKPMEGEIVSGNGEYRTEGDARLGCPQGKLSYRVLKKCTVWSDLIYELGDHDAQAMPEEDLAAPKALLLVNFGRTVKYQSDLDLAESGVPGDVFEFSGCAK